MKEFIEEEQKQQYSEYVKQVTPTHSLPMQMAKAFATGGIICCLGQAVLNYAGSLGLEKDIAGAWCSMLLVLLSVVLTGFNIFPGISKHSQMGRGRSPGAYHRICQQRGGAGH